MTESPTDDECVAHHEAAHAVIALELGQGILDVGIDLRRVDATGGIGNVGCRLFIADLGNIEPSEIEAEQRRLLGQIDCSGAVLAAGAASDAKLRGEDPWFRSINSTLTSTRCAIYCVLQSLTRRPRRRISDLEHSWI